MKKRRFRTFGLRTFLIAILGLGVILGLVSKVLVQYRSEMAVLKRITGFDHSVPPELPAFTVPAGQVSSNQPAYAQSQYVISTRADTWRMTRNESSTYYNIGIG